MPSSHHKESKAMSEKGINDLQNAAKTLFANIKYSSVDEDIRLISISSTQPDEGKTTTVVALGMAIATSGKTVLMVEADMRRRSLAKVLHAQPVGGAYAVITGESRLEDVMWATATPGLYFLDIEPNIPNPADLLSSKRYAEFVDNVAAKFDYVIFDTPPVGVFVDAAILGTIVDTTILVVRAGQTKREAAKAALKQLQQVGAPVLGTVITFSEEQSSNYYYYAYYTKNEDEKGRITWSRTK